MEVIGSRLGENLNPGSAVAALCSVEGCTGDANGVDEVRFRGEVHDAIARSAVEYRSVDIVFVVFLALACGIDLVSRFLFETVIVCRARTEGAATAKPDPVMPGAKWIMLVYTFLPIRGAVSIVCCEISREVSLLSVSTAATPADTCTVTAWFGSASEGRPSSFRCFRV